MTFSSTILLTAHEDFTEGIKYLDLIREVLFSSSIEPGKMNRLRRKTIKVLFYVDLSYITALYFSSLYVGNMDDQCRGPSIKEKDHLVGSLTSGFKTGMVGTQSREARPAPAQGKSCPGLLRPQNFFFCPPRPETQKWLPRVSLIQSTQSTCMQLIKLESFGCILAVPPVWAGGAGGPSPEQRIFVPRF